MSDYPRHQPIAPEAPIPGRHWYGGCCDSGFTVGEDGVCEGCGETACPVCGGGYYGPGKRGCQCPPATVLRTAAGAAFDWHKDHPGEKAPAAAAFAAMEYGVDANTVLALMREAVSEVMAALEGTVTD